MKVVVAKMTGEGEQTTFEFTVNSEKDISKLVNAYRMADGRMREMNERYLAALKTMEEFPPELRIKFRYAIDCLYGQRLDQLTNIPHLAAEKPKESKGNGTSA